MMSCIRKTKLTVEVGKHLFIKSEQATFGYNYIIPRATTKSDINVTGGISALLQFRSMSLLQDSLALPSSTDG